MALEITLLLDDPDPTNGTSFVSPSASPVGGSAVLVGIMSDFESVPSLSTPNWLDGSWNLEGQTDSGTNFRLSVFSGQVVESPSAEAITVTFGVSQFGCHIMAVQVTGQNPLDFVRQTKVAAANAAGLSATLDAALESIQNACVGFFAHAFNERQAPTGGETEVGDSGHGNPARNLAVQYEINDTTTGASWVTTSRAAVVALEVVANTEQTRPFANILIRG